MQRVQGDAATGNVTVITVGVSSTTIVEGSFPAATVTVFNQGTLVLASIFGDNGITPKANPFSAASDGSWFFYAANGRYDIALAATGLSRTLGDVLLNDPANNQNIGGQLLLKDGTAASPSLAFTSETNTGFYKSAANQIAWVVTGVRKWLIDIGIRLGATFPLTWSSGVDPFGNAADTSLSRTGAATVAVGNGTQGDITGTLTATQVNASLIKQISAAAFVINDANGVAHFFLSSAAPFTNTFIQGNGGGTTFFGVGGTAINIPDVGGVIVFPGATSGAINLKATAIAGGNTLTLPAATDTLIGKATTDTLTNKSLTAPAITGAATIAAGATITSPVINGTPSGTGIPTATLKSGTGVGNYTTASTTFVRVDAANLALNAVTIPVGWKLIVQASGCVSQATATAGVDIALADGSADNTGILIAVHTSPGTAGVDQFSPFSLTWIITGDGAAHTINLQYLTGAGADSAIMANSSATLRPMMVFLLTPSN